MNTQKSRSIPTELERLRRRFERLRHTRGARSRIPEPLWAAAVRMAEQHGVNRTAQALRLSYYSLKERVGEKTAAGPGTSTLPFTTPFIELATPLPSGACQCSLELENAEGVRMRVQLRSAAMPDLAAISRSVLAHEP